MNTFGTIKLLTQNECVCPRVLKFGRKLVISMTSFIPILTLLLLQNPFGFPEATTSVTTYPNYQECANTVVELWFITAGG